MENWSLRMMISFSFSVSLNFFLLKHTSQELDSNTAKLLLENQLKYPSLLLLLSYQLELSFAFTFIHLPTGGNGRKSNDVRLIGIVIPIAIETRPSIKRWRYREDLLLMCKSRTSNEKELSTVQYHAREISFAWNVIRKQLEMFARFYLFVWSICRMDKVLVYLIKNERKTFSINNRMA